MNDIEHPRLGKLEYDGEDGWNGWITLPRFAECRSRTHERNIQDQRLLEQGDEISEDEDLRSEYDSEEIDDQIHRVQGQLRLRVQEVGRAGLSPAQERSLDYLLDHEEEVLNAILEAQFRSYREYVDEERDFQAEFGIEFEDVPRGINSPKQLKQRMSFADIELQGDAIDGFVRIDLSGACDWDIEHGFDIELIKDRVLDFEEELSDGFPCQVPESIDLGPLLPTDDQTRPVEFLIYGRWSGIYQIDRNGNVVKRMQCLLCPGNHWDPEGVEDVRVPEASHLKMATSPFAILLPGLVLAGGCLAPLLLVLGLLIWGGLFWGALGLTVAELLGRAIHPLLRKETKSGDLSRAAVIIACSIAGLVYWQKGGAAGPNAGFVTAVGWIVWCLSAYAFVISVKNSAITLAGIGREGSALPLSVAWPNFVFAGVVGVALWRTYAGFVSKLHLIWIVPATLVICFLLGVRTMMQRLRSMGGKWQDGFFQPSHKETIIIDPDEKHRNDSADDEDEAND